VKIDPGALHTIGKTTGVGTTQPFLERQLQQQGYVGHQTLRGEAIGRPNVVGW
jgi:hypothetical protein